MILKIIKKYIGYELEQSHWRDHYKYLLMSGFLYLLILLTIKYEILYKIVKNLNNI